MDKKPLFDWQADVLNQLPMKAEYENYISSYSNAILNCRSAVGQAFKCVNQLGASKCQKSIGSLAFCLSEFTHKGDKRYQQAVQCIRENRGCNSEVRSLVGVVIADYAEKTNKALKNANGQEMTATYCNQEKTVNEQISCQASLLCPKMFDNFLSCLKDKSGQKVCNKEGKEFVKCIGKYHNTVILLSSSQVFASMV